MLDNGRNLAAGNTNKQKMNDGSLDYNFIDTFGVLGEFAFF